VHSMPPYKENTHYPIAEDLSKKGLNLPSSVKLSENDLSKIATVLRSFS
jgi:perosamine synthetase